MRARVMRGPSVAIAIAMASLLSMPAAADILPPARLVCPRGAWVLRDHHNAWCEPAAVCSTDAECRARAARCESVGLCIEQSVRSLPLAFERHVAHAGGSCEADMQCPPMFECVVERRCIAEPLELPPPSTPTPEEHGSLRTIVVVSALLTLSVVIVVWLTRRRARPR